MESLMKRYTQLYSRAQVQVDKWSEARARLLSAFTSASAIIARLPVIEDQRNYGACFSQDRCCTDASVTVNILCGDALKRALVGKQVESLESVLKAMNAAVQEMWEASGVLSRLAEEGHWAWERSRPRPTPAQLSKRWGVQPSISDCVQGLNSLAEMHRDEINLKLAVLGAISYHTSEEDLAAVQSVLKDEPNIPPHVVTEIFQKVAINL